VVGNEKIDSEPPWNVHPPRNPNHDRLLVSQASPLNLLIASAEAIPYAKTGGLADVAGALPREFAKLGHDVILLLPHYRCVNDSGRSFRQIARLPIRVPAGVVDISIYEDIVPVTGHPAGFRVWAIRHDPSFDRVGLYQEEGQDYPDNLDRFTLFCRSIIETIVYLRREMNWKTDLLHLHDWQTALCSAYLKTVDRGRKELEGVKTVLTLHNAGYQGIFPGSQFSKTGLPSSLFALNGFEFYGSTNLLKGGIVFSDYLTTVSPTYARELLTPEGGFGLDGVLRTRQAEFQGILNGIDIDLWNPETDPYLPATFSASDRSGKLICKHTLQREFNLPETQHPLVAAIGRLTSQKGFDLIEEIIPQLMTQGVQLVMLGSGEHELEERFRALQARYRDHMGLRIGFDEGLAHRIEGGADMLIMPSRYEPCGLSQLYSLRYGTVPIVRKTGGLADTIVPLASQALKAGRVTGFHMVASRADALLDSVNHALTIYNDRATWNRIVEAGMKSDFSWTRSAKTYANLFMSLVGTVT